MSSSADNLRPGKFRQILGIRFFVGSARETIDQIRGGGLLVVPAAPALKDLAVHREYREALLGADLAITDSIMMVLLWNVLTGDSLPRVSGLKYLRELLRDPELREQGNTFWIMASPQSAERNLAWLHDQGISVRPQDVYLAPMYSAELSDPQLLEILNAHPYRHVIVTVGGGTQERLGLYLKRNLNHLPAIHCIGAAIAFLSGDQVRISPRADAYGLGWLLRCLSKPRTYVPRYWSARKLAWLMIRYKQNMPPLEN